VNPACLDLDGERGMQPLQRHGAGVEEADRQQAAGLAAQEAAPDAAVAVSASSSGQSSTGVADSSQVYSSTRQPNSSMQSQ
jgi:hypothetical protein